MDFQQLFSQMEWSWLVQLPSSREYPMLRALTGAIFGIACMVRLPQHGSIDGGDPAVLCKKIRIHISDCLLSGLVHLPTLLR
jgi:hypothetical protein